MNSRPRPIPPGPGQESVWDYPRPPRLELSACHLTIRFGGSLIADTRRALRFLETSHPPSWYLPRADIDTSVLKRSEHHTFCEWKGAAHYYDVQVGETLAAQAAWAYDSPRDVYRQLREHVAFYPQPMDECTLDGEVVKPQPGDFYGGWVTSKVVGPFKGETGSWGW